jgi:hypothetical protein
MWIHDQSLNMLTTASCVFKSATMDATRVASSICHLLDSASCLEARLYTLLRDLSQRIRGSAIKRNITSNRGSPWSVPLRALIKRVCPREI